MYSTTYCAKENIWKGPNLPLMYHTDVSVGRVILHSLDLANDKVIQVNKSSIFHN